MNYEHDYLDEPSLSECCGAPIVGEIIDGIGLCFNCHEWSGVIRTKDAEK